MERKAGDVLRVFLDETLKYVLPLRSSVGMNDDGDVLMIEPIRDQR
jgi:hypothetical protein